MPAPLDQLFHEGLAVLEVVAHRIARRLGFRVEVEDLIALGRPALMEIARTYDPNRSNFRAYALRRLHWAVLDGVRRETRWRSVFVRATALAASERIGEASRQSAESIPPTQGAHQRQLDHLLERHAAAMVLGLVAQDPDEHESVPDDTDDPEERAARAEMAHAVRRALRSLPERERTLIERHYYGGERFDEIAQALGISKSWASRIHAQGIEMLGRALRPQDEQEDNDE